MLTKNDFDAVDNAALDRSLEMTLAESDDHGRVEQVQQMLAESGWWATASFCSYHQQFKNLHLTNLRHATPCWIDPDQIDEIIARGQHHFDFGAAKMLRRMLDAGVSRFDPTPEQSIAAAKEKTPSP